MRIDDKRPSGSVAPAPSPRAIPASSKPFNPGPPKYMTTHAPAHRASSKPYNPGPPKYMTTTPTPARADDRPVVRSNPIINYGVPATMGPMVTPSRNVEHASSTAEDPVAKGLNWLGRRVSDDAKGFWHQPGGFIRGIGKGLVNTVVDTGAFAAKGRAVMWRAEAKTLRALGHDQQADRFERDANKDFKGINGFAAKHRMKLHGKGERAGSDLAFVGTTVPGVGTATAKLGSVVGQVGTFAKEMAVTSKVRNPSTIGKTSVPHAAKQSEPSAGSLRSRPPSSAASKPAPRTGGVRKPPATPTKEAKASTVHHAPPRHAPASAPQPKFVPRQSGGGGHAPTFQPQKEVQHQARSAEPRSAGPSSSMPKATNPDTKIQRSGHAGQNPVQRINSYDSLPKRGPLEPQRASNAPKLDWSRSGRDGSSAADHVIRNHGAYELSKPNKSAFYGPAQAVVDRAWDTVQKTGLQPFRERISNVGVDKYVVPYPNSGFFASSGEVLNHVTIVTETGTNKVITAYPSAANMPLKDRGFMPQPQGDRGPAQTLRAVEYASPHNTGNYVVNALKRVDELKATVGKGPVVFRFDTREPQQILREGFTPRGQNASLLDHLNSPKVSGGSMYVSTTESRGIADSYGLMQPSGYVYTIRRPSEAFSPASRVSPAEKAEMGESYDLYIERASDQKELLVPGHIPSEEIIGYREVMNPMQQLKQGLFDRVHKKEFVFPFEVNPKFNGNAG